MNAALTLLTLLADSSSPAAARNGLDRRRGLPA
jgi:hypothetical protein